MASAPTTHALTIDGVAVTITCAPTSSHLTEIAGALHLAMTAHIKDRAKLAKDIAKRITQEATP